MPGEITVHKYIILLYFVFIFDGEIKQELGLYSDFKHIPVISVTLLNWKTSAIEAVILMPLTPYPNQPLTKISHLRS